VPQRAIQPNRQKKQVDRREHASKRGYDHKWERYSLKYRNENPLCVRCLQAGRTTAAECVDHIQPVVDGQNDPLFWTPENHQSLCWDCHTVKTQTEDKGSGRSKARGTAGVEGTLVYGAPCSGKKAYVTAHMALGDIVLDVDALHTALTGLPTHDQEQTVLPFVYEARDAVRKKLEQSGFGRRVWVIASAATVKQRQQWRHLCRQEHHVTADMTVCLNRAKVERPIEWQGYIKQWFADFEHG
jgi:5-methylcytosine-specific restriction protein A